MFNTSNILLKVWKTFETYDFEISKDDATRGFQTSCLSLWRFALLPERGELRSHMKSCSTATMWWCEAAVPSHLEDGNMSTFGDTWVPKVIRSLLMLYDVCELQRSHIKLVQHGRIALQDQLSRLEAVADEFRVFVSETCKSHNCQNLIYLDHVVLRCLKDKRLFSRSLFFTISTRHGIMESWNHGISMFGLRTWFVSGYCIGARSRWLKAFQKSFKLFFGFPFHMGSHWVFHSMFFVFFFRLSGLRAKIFGSTSPCCWKVSLWEAFRLTATPPPRINAFLSRGYRDPNKSL